MTVNSSLYASTLDPPMTPIPTLTSMIPLSLNRLLPWVPAILKKLRYNLIATKTRIKIRKFLMDY